MKIDLGVHVDGFIAVVAHSYIVPGIHPTNPLSAADAAKRDNVISAAYTAAEVAVRLMKAGNTNAMVTAAIKQVLLFSFKLVIVLSHFQCTGL